VCSIAGQVYGVQDVMVEMVFLGHGEGGNRYIEIEAVATMTLVVLQRAGVRHLARVLGAHRKQLADRVYCYD
jgi:hypothetical protein